MNHKGNVVSIDSCLNNVSQNDAWCFSNRIAEEQSSRSEYSQAKHRYSKYTHTQCDGSLLAASATAVVAVAASVVVVVVSIRR